MSEKLKSLLIPVPKGMIAEDLENFRSSLFHGGIAKASYASVGIHEVAEVDFDSACFTLDEEDVKSQPSTERNVYVS